MFSTCIFCNKPLGQNESIESFPVGQRLAFDPARGRLWVVCRGCERWNLSPLEERWEAIEQADRLFADTRRRVSTDNIGLAKLSEGTTLIRIGDPQRPEFAAWRYGDQFGRRRLRALAIAGGGVAAVGAVIAGGAAAGVSIGGFAWMFGQLGRSVIYGRADAVVARVRAEGHGLVDVRRRHLAESSVDATDSGDLILNLRFKNGSTQLVGPEAQRVAAQVLPQVNRFGGRKTEIAEAVQHIEGQGNSERFLSHMGRLGSRFIRQGEALSGRDARQRQRDFNKYGLFSIPAAHRLALEMALHEEAERRALEGELESLERAWQDAEEIAAIADNLLVPPSMDDQLRKLKEGK